MSSSLVSWQSLSLTHSESDEEEAELEEEDVDFSLDGQPCLFFEALDELEEDEDDGFLSSMGKGVFFTGSLGLVRRAIKRCWASSVHAPSWPGLSKSCRWIVFIMLEMCCFKSGTLLPWRVYSPLPILLRTSSVVGRVIVIFTSSSTGAKESWARPSFMCTVPMTLIDAMRHRKETTSIGLTLKQERTGYRRPLSRSWLSR